MYMVGTQGMSWMVETEGMWRKFKGVDGTGEGYWCTETCAQMVRRGAKKTCVLVWGKREAHRR